MKYALLARFLLLNLAFAAGGYLAFKEGWLLPFIDNLISYAIVALYFVGLGIASFHALKISRGLNEAKAGVGADLERFRSAVARVGAERAAMALEKRLESRGGVLVFLCETLVILGLLGTALGFWLTFQSLDLTNIDTADGLRALANAIEVGFQLAMTTTVAGIAAALALGSVLQMLETATAKLMAAVLDG